MRWPIRNQILLPLVLIQLLVVTGMSSLAAWWSLARVEQGIDQRLTELSRSLTAASYPLNDSVLNQLRGLTGAEFILRNSDAQVIAATGPRLTPPEIDEINLPQTEASRVRVEHAGYMLTRVPLAGPSRGMDVLILYPNHLIRAARADAVRGPLIFGVLTLALSLAAMIPVSRRMGRRMQAIERQVARVAAGDFEPIPLPDRNDELRDLSASVNQMGRDLERFTAQIRETERAHLIKQLAGGIAHQLRNAITGARLTVQLHQRRCSQSRDGSLDVALRQLTLIEEQIRGLVALIRDEQRERVAGQLDDLLVEVETLVRPLCDHRQIHLVRTGELLDFRVRDKDQMRAALLNLTLNAVEATGAGGHVAIACRQRGDLAEIEVCDDGPGVPEHLVEEMFLPFRTTKPDGMGLGLSLVQQAAADHGGAIVYQRHNGQTCFQLTCTATPAGAVALKHPSQSPARLETVESGT